MIQGFCEIGCTLTGARNFLVPDIRIQPLDRSPTAEPPTHVAH